MFDLQDAPVELARRESRRWAHPRAFCPPIPDARRRRPPARPLAERAGRRDRLVASEEPGFYDVTAGADRPEAPSGPGDAPAGSAERRDCATPRSIEARKRLERAATTPGSPLGAALGQLAAAVDALAAAAADEEHVDVVGDALVAVDYLRSRMDAVLLRLLADFDRRDGHRADGAVTAGSWLRARTNSDFSSTATLAWAARRRDDLPRLAAHLDAGDITLAHFTAVTKAATPARLDSVSAAEDSLADLALANPPRDVRLTLRRLAETIDPDGSDPANHADDAGADPLRDLTLRRGYGGRGEVFGTLDPLTREALEVLLDAFDTPDGADTPPRERRTHGQRRHDAFAALLHTLLAQPQLPSVQGARPTILINVDLAAALGLPADHPVAGMTLADIAALLGIDLTDLGLADPDDAPDPAESSDNPDPADGDADNGEQVAGYADAGDPGAPADPAPPADAGDVEPPADPAPPAPAGPTGSPPARPPRFGSGVATTPATVRSLLGQATVMAVLTLGPWRVVNVGSKHRTLPGWLRCVLMSMHRHCRGPDCDRPASWTEAHHILPWIVGRTTDLNDSLPLCPAHHKLLDQGWSVDLDLATGVVTWTSPTGRVIHVPPPPP